MLQAEVAWPTGRAAHEAFGRAWKRARQGAGPGRARPPPSKGKDSWHLGPWALTKSEVAKSLLLHISRQPPMEEGADGAARARRAWRERRSQAQG